jgi:hypothetical protein
MLTTGTSFYFRFGFKYVSSNNNLIYEQNKSKLDKLKTNDIDLAIFIRLILNRIKDVRTIYNHDFLSDIIYVVSIYDELKDKPLYDFFKNMSYECCELFSLIHIDLFKILGLEMLSDTNMYLKM